MTLALDKRVDIVEDKTDSLETVLKKFIISTNASLLRLEYTIKDFKNEMSDFKDEMRDFKNEMTDFKLTFHTLISLNENNFIMYKICRLSGIRSPHIMIHTKLVPFGIGQ